jgi:hypothetical protein
VGKNYSLSVPLDVKVYPNVTVYVTCPNGTACDNNIVKTGDGICISFVPQIPGEYSLLVMANGRSLSAPLTIDVVQGVVASGKNKRYRVGKRTVCQKVMANGKVKVEDIEVNFVDKQGATVLDFAPKIVDKGEWFNISILPSKKGTYFVEIRINGTTVEKPREIEVKGPKNNPKKRKTTKESDYKRETLASSYGKENDPIKLPPLNASPKDKNAKSPVSHSLRVRDYRRKDLQALNFSNEENNSTANVLNRKQSTRDFSSLRFSKSTLRRASMFFNLNPEIPLYDKTNETQSPRTDYDNKKQVRLQSPSADPGTRNLYSPEDEKNGPEYPRRVFNRRNRLSRSTSAVSTAKRKISDSIGGISRKPDKIERQDKTEKQDKIERQDKTEKPDDTKIDPPKPEQQHPILKPSMFESQNSSLSQKRSTQDLARRVHHRTLSTTSKLANLIHSNPSQSDSQKSLHMSATHTHNNVPVEGGNLMKSEGPSPPGYIPISPLLRDEEKPKLTKRASLKLREKYFSAPMKGSPTRLSSRRSLKDSKLSSKLLSKRKSQKRINDPPPPVSDPNVRQLYVSILPSENFDWSILSCCTVNVTGDVSPSATISSGPGDTIIIQFIPPQIGRYFIQIFHGSQAIFDESIKVIVETLVRRSSCKNKTGERNLFNTGSLLDKKGVAVTSYPLNDLSVITSGPAVVTGHLFNLGIENSILIEFVPPKPGMYKAQIYSKGQSILPNPVGLPVETELVQQLISPPVLNHVDSDGLKLCLRPIVNQDYILLDYTASDISAEIKTATNNILKGTIEVFSDGRVEVTFPPTPEGIHSAQVYLWGEAIMPAPVEIYTMTRKPKKMEGVADSGVESTSIALARAEECRALEREETLREQCAKLTVIINESSEITTPGDNQADWPNILKLVEPLFSLNQSDWADILTQSEEQIFNFYNNITSTIVQTVTSITTLLPSLDSTYKSKVLADLKNIERTFYRFFQVVSKTLKLEEKHRISLIEDIVLYSHNIKAYFIRIIALYKKFALSENTPTSVPTLTHINSESFHPQKLSQLSSPYASKKASPKEPVLSPNGIAENFKRVTMEEDLSEPVSKLVNFLNSDVSRHISCESVCKPYPVPHTLSDAINVFSEMVKQLLPQLRNEEMRDPAVLVPLISKNILFVRNIILENFITDENWNLFVQQVDTFSQILIDMLGLKLHREPITPRINEFFAVLRQISGTVRFVKEVPSVVAKQPLS